MEKKPTIVVTGSQGQLGKSLTDLESDYPQFKFVFLSRSDMPIHHFELVRQFFEGIQPDYVINAGGIIAVALEYLAREHGQPSSLEEVHRRLEEIPGRLTAIWDESKASGRSADQVADSMAQRLIGR